MGPSLPLAALFALAGGCALPESPVGHAREPIVGGEPTSDHPAVGALVLRRRTCGEAPPGALCTVTLVAPELALTAGHCVDSYGERQLEVVFGQAVDDPAAVWRVVVAHHLPADYDTLSSDADLALLRLAAPVDIPPVATSRSALDASLAGASVVLVGFGESEDGNGAKRSGAATVTEVTATTFRYAPGPAMTCGGDSGGPAFLERDGELVLIGVTSAGDPACESWGVDTRVDTHAGSFLDPVLSAPRAPPTASVAPESICAAPCTADVECPGALRCEGAGEGSGRCASPTVDPGDFGSTCATAADCEPGSECRPYELACRCHTPCAVDPPPPGPGGGCAVAGPRVGPRAFLAGLLAWTWPLLRRRRGRHHGSRPRG